MRSKSAEVGGELKELKRLVANCWSKNAEAIGRSIVEGELEEWN